MRKSSPRPVTGVFECILIGLRLPTSSTYVVHTVTLALALQLQGRRRSGGIRPTPPIYHQLSLYILLLGTTTYYCTPSCCHSGRKKWRVLWGEKCCCPDRILNKLLTDYFMDWLFIEWWANFCTLLSRQREPAMAASDDPIWSWA